MMTVHGYEFSEPVVAKPKSSFDLTSYLILIAVVWGSWKLGWLHKGIPQSTEGQA